MSKTINLGRVTAYADAVAAGYTGTREQFANDLANAANYAAEAGDAAETATEAATTASTAAGTATTKAEEASADADQAHADAQAILGAKETAVAAAATATSKAGEAANSAQQAAASETAAAGSATAASNAATSATASKNAAATSETNAANSANAAAQTLTNVNQAGATQVAAIQAKGTEVLNSIPADYTELSDDVDALKSDLAYINNDIIDIVNFKLLNGFDVNNTQSGVYNATGGIDASSSYTSSLTYARVKPGVNYQAFYSATGKKEYTAVAWYDASFGFLSKSSGTDLLATAPSNAAYCRVSVPNANIATTVFVEGAVFSGYHAFGYDLILKEEVDTPALSAIEQELTPFAYDTTAQSGYLTATGIYDGSLSYHSITTNKIDCKEDDVFTYTGIGKWSAQSYLIYNALNAIIDYGQIEGTGDVTIPENGIAIMFSSFAANGTDVTLNVKKKAQLNLADQVAKNTADIELLAYNPLKGKKLSVTGDSICYGEAYTGGYAKIIGENNNMTVQNIAVSGGTIVNKSGAFCISESIANMDSNSDYAIIEGGFNDAASQSAPPLGTLASGYNAQYDTTTFYGAFETMLRDLFIRFAGKKIGYVAVHQATNNFRVENDPETSYYWAARKCCEKWGVPFCDLNVLVPAFGYFTATNADLLAIKNAYTLNGDGTHPTEICYRKYYAPKIEAWMKTL